MIGDYKVVSVVRIHEYTTYTVGVTTYYLLRPKYKNLHMFVKVKGTDLTTLQTTVPGASASASASVASAFSHSGLSIQLISITNQTSEI